MHKIIKAMNRIKEILKEKDITVNQLSEMLGVSRQALSKQIQGKMLVETAEKISEALGVEMWELFASREEVMEQNKNTIPCPHCGKPIEVSLLKKEEE